MRKSSLLIVFLIVFIDLVGFGIVIPILPYYAKQFGASAWELGWLMTSYSLMQFVMAPVWGRLSDRVGRRPVLLTTLAATGASMVFLGFAQSLLWLFIGRTLAGIFGANISTANAYIADVTDEANRAKGMGVIGAAFGLGFIFGPAIGGLLSTYGYGVPMFAGATLAGLNVIFAFFKLEEPPLSVATRASHRTKRFDTGVIRTALEDPRSRLAIGLFLLVTFAITQMEVVFAIYLKDRFNYDARSAGVLLALSGIVMVLIQGGLIGRLAKRYGELRLVRVGLVLCGLGLGLFPSATTMGVLIGWLCIMSLGHGLLHPSLSSLASKGAAEWRRGATLGVFQSAGSLARVLGPPCAGWLYDQAGSGSPFFAGAAVLAVALVLALMGGAKEMAAAPV